MRKGLYMVRTYRSGRVTEKSKYSAGNATKVRAPRTGKGTPPRKQDQNDRAVVKVVARHINCNYGHGDLLVTATYDAERLKNLTNGLIDEGRGIGDAEIREAAIRERNRFLRRVKLDMRKQGLELKFIAVTADVDGETKKTVRIHHHIIVPKEAREFIIKHWGEDCLDIKPLRDEQDYTQVAVYLMSQVRRQPDLRKFSTSRNLEKPIITEELVYDASELAAPHNANVRERVYCPESDTQYLRYIEPPPKAPKRGGKKLGDTAPFQGAHKVLRR